MGFDKATAERGPIPEPRAQRRFRRAIEGNDALPADNTRFFTAVEFNGKRQVSTVDAPFPAPAIKTVPAAKLMEPLLATVGASLPMRDAVDARLIEHVRNLTGKLIDSQTEVGCWPQLQSGTAPEDTDGDGMPDAWETSHGLNPRDPSDGAKDRNRDGYTNLEEYLNSLVPAV